MNDFFKIKRVIFFSVLVGICIILMVVQYFRLSMQPVTAIAKDIPEVERGSIVDRLGVPLAITFY